MRKPLSMLAVIALTGTMTVALTGTAFAKGGGGSSTPKVPKVTSCQTKTATLGITQAMTAFLSGGSAAASMKYVDQGAKIGPSYVASQAADTAAGLTSPTKPTYPTGVKVQCTGKTKANFTYDLYIKDLTTGTTGAPLGLSENGDALIKKGVWYISGSTVCDLTAASPAPGAVAASAQCYMAIGLPVPPAS